MLVKLDHFPRVQGENKKYLSCHHLVKEYMGIFLETNRGDVLNNWGQHNVIEITKKIPIGFVENLT